MAPQPVGPKIEARLPDSLLATVDSRAAAAGHSRAAELRNLIEAGLAAQPTATPQRGCTGRCEHANDLRRNLAALGRRHAAEVAELTAARDLAEALLAKSKSERGAAPAERRSHDKADTLALLRATIPHLPANMLRARVQQAVRSNPNTLRSKR